MYPAQDRAHSSLTRAHILFYRGNKGVLLPSCPHLPRSPRACLVFISTAWWYLYRSAREVTKSQLTAPVRTHVFPGRSAGVHLANALAAVPEQQHPPRA